jgi:hypothetical protein
VLTGLLNPAEQSIREETLSGSLAGQGQNWADQHRYVRVCGDHRK